jgi:uncharacterized OB-fold protein
MVTEHTRPLPDIDDPATAPFWEQAKANRLVAQRCVRCGAMRWTPRNVCPTCWSLESTWDDLRPIGTLYSYATYHRPFDRRFTDEIPYTVGFIELDDGIRMIGTMEGDPQSFVVGAAVRAVFRAVTSEVTLVMWEMV